jgi:hypothetical protein
MNNNQVAQLKLEIDSIKEYLETELCKKCEEMSNRLQECYVVLERLNENNN